MSPSFRLSKLSKRFSSKRRSSPKTREYEEAFRIFDANGDGKISSEELKLFLSCNGEDVSLAGAQAAMKDFDVDGDGFLDYEEFLSMVNSGGGEDDDDDGDEDLKKAFEMMEVEKGAGFITACGLKRMMRRIVGEEKSDDECAAMIRAFDLDGNGVLDYHEFLRMMR